MLNLLRQTGRAAGAAGFLLCLLAGLARLGGWHWLGGYETVTLLQAGIGGMVFGCFCLLLILTEPSARP